MNMGVVHRAVSKAVLNNTIALLEISARAVLIQDTFHTRLMGTTSSTKLHSELQYRRSENESEFL